MSQLQRCVGKGSAEMGTLKVCVAAPQWQETARALVSRSGILDCG